jgi:hypothetical protein
MSRSLGQSTVDAPSPSETPPVRWGEFVSVGLGNASGLSGHHHAAPPTGQDELAHSTCAPWLPCVRRSDGAVALVRATWTDQAVTDLRWTPTDERTTSTVEVVRAQPRRRGQLSHPSLAPVVAADGGTHPFVIVERPPGVSLAQWLGERGVMRAAMATRVLQLLASVADDADELGFLLPELTVDTVYIVPESFRTTPARGLDPSAPSLRVVPWITLKDRASLRWADPTRWNQRQDIVAIAFIGLQLLSGRRLPIALAELPERLAQDATLWHGIPPHLVPPLQQALTPFTATPFTSAQQWVQQLTEAAAPATPEPPVGRWNGAPLPDTGHHWVTTRTHRVVASPEAHAPANVVATPAKSRRPFVGRAALLRGGCWCFLGVLGGLWLGRTAPVGPRPLRTPTALTHRHDSEAHEPPAPRGPLGQGGDAATARASRAPARAPAFTAWSANDAPRLPVQLHDILRGELSP